MVRPRPPKPWTPAGAARLLIVRLSALGDVIHALPVLPALRCALPDIRIDWVVEDRAAALVEARSDLDRVVVFPRRDLDRLRRRPVARVRLARQFVRELRSEIYDAALDLQGNLKSGVILRISGARHRYGLDRRAAREANHLFSTRRALPDARHHHHVERNLDLVAALVGHPVSWSDPGFVTHSEHAARAETLLVEAGVSDAARLVVLHPGTSEFGAFKRWPPQHYADLARQLTDGVADARVIVVAPPGEADLARAVARRAGNRVTIIDTPGIGVLGELLRRAHLFVGADTGPTHLAALVGTPVVSLYGPKDPSIYGPWGRRLDGSAGVLAVVTRSDVACRPCGLRRCADPICMTGLAPEEVLRAADRLGT